MMKKTFFGLITVICLFFVSLHAHAWKDYDNSKQVADLTNRLIPTGTDMIELLGVNPKTADKCLVRFQYSNDYEESFSMTTFDPDKDSDSDGFSASFMNLNLSSHSSSMYIKSFSETDDHIKLVTHKNPQHQYETWRENTLEIRFDDDGNISKVSINETSPVFWIPVVNVLQICNIY